MRRPSRITDTSHPFWRAARNPGDVPPFSPAHLASQRRPTLLSDMALESSPILCKKGGTSPWSWTKGWDVAIVGTKWLKGWDVKQIPTSGVALESFFPSQIRPTLFTAQSRDHSDVPPFRTRSQIRPTLLQRGSGGAQRRPTLWGPSTDTSHPFFSWFFGLARAVRKGWDVAGMTLKRVGRRRDGSAVP